MPRLLTEIPAGPVDVVGDVHGEVEALDALLAHLGYDRDARHRNGRRLVFVGDLVDRGPDSLAVVRRVRAWMEAGRALCVVGNHELNLVLGKERAGNEWFWGREQPLREGGGVIPQALAGDRDREEILLFIQTLPLALARDELRVVHACWHEPAIAALRRERRGLVDLFYDAERDVTQSCMSDGEDPQGLAADLARQNRNPVTALTSGLERRTAEPFEAGGRLRRVERVPWWEDYRDQVPVIFGHYWRALDPRDRPVKRGPYLFEGAGSEVGLGPHRNAYCIDFSVGYRNVGRAHGDAKEHATALAPLRVPEFTLMDDAGRRRELGAPS